MRPKPLRNLNLTTSGFKGNSSSDLEAKHQKLSPKHQIWSWNIRNGNRGYLYRIRSWDYYQVKSGTKTILKNYFNSNTSGSEGNSTSDIPFEETLPETSDLMLKHQKRQRWHKLLIRSGVESHHSHSAQVDALWRSKWHPLSVRLLYVISSIELIYSKTNYLTAATVNPGI